MPQSGVRFFDSKSERQHIKISAGSISSIDRWYFHQDYRVSANGQDVDGQANSTNISLNVSINVTKSVYDSVFPVISTCVYIAEQDLVHSLEVNKPRSVIKNKSKKLKEQKGSDLSRIPITGGLVNSGYFNQLYLGKKFQNWFQAHPIVGYDSSSADASSEPWPSYTFCADLSEVGRAFFPAGYSLQPNQSGVCDHGSADLHINVSHVGINHTVDKNYVNLGNEKYAGGCLMPTALTYLFDPIEHRHKWKRHKNIEFIFDSKTDGKLAPCQIFHKTVAPPHRLKFNFHVQIASRFHRGSRVNSIEGMLKLMNKQMRDPQVIKLALQYFERLAVNKPFSGEWLDDLPHKQYTAYSVVRTPVPDVANQSLFQVKNRVQRAGYDPVQLLSLVSGCD